MEFSSIPSQVGQQRTRYVSTNRTFDITTNPLCDSYSVYHPSAFFSPVREFRYACSSRYCPTSLIVISIDRLLLLESGGETVYFGDIGSDSHVIRQYFAKHGAICPPNVNPAEFMLEAIGAGVTPRIGDRDWKDIWLDSQEYQTAKDELAKLKAVALAKPQDQAQDMSTCEFYLPITGSEINIPRRCHASLVPVEDCCEKRKPFLVETARLHLQSSLHSRLLFVVRLAFLASIRTLHPRLAI